MARFAIGNLFLDFVSMDDTLRWIGAVIRSRSCETGTSESWRVRHIVTPNSQMLHLAATNSHFASIARNADLGVADGVPIVWASRLLRTPLPERVNGTDLMFRICEEAALNQWTTYFLGGRPGAAEEASHRLRQLYPGLLVAGLDCPPMGFDTDIELDKDVTQRIRNSAPAILFVGLGAPKQEVWINSHRNLPVAVAIGIGGSFEMAAGMSKRAPALFQRSGLEWLWRLMIEPRRMAGRYLVCNSYFVWLVLREWVASRVVKMSGSSGNTDVPKEIEE